MFGFPETAEFYKIRNGKCSFTIVLNLLVKFSWHLTFYLVMYAKFCMAQQNKERQNAFLEGESYRISLKN